MAGADIEQQEWRVRPARPEDREQALQLLRRVFGPEDAPDRRRWDWTFVENPSGAGMRYVIAETDDRMIGQFAALPTRMQHDGGELTGLIGLDTALDHEYRGQGLMTEMLKAFYDPRDDPDAGRLADRRVLAYGFVNAASYSMFTKRLWATELRPTPILARPVAGLGDVARSWRGWAAPLGVAGELAFRALGAAHSGVARVARDRRRIEPLERFGPWADRLWEELSPDLGTCTIRDSAYLNWRYLEAPFAYERLALVGPDGPEGFAIVGELRRRGLDLDVLMELMVRPGDATGARLLLERVVRSATARRRSAIVAVATPRHPQLRALRWAGFLPAPASLTGGIHFSCWAVGPGLVPNELYHVDDWYLSGADLDFM